MSEALEKNAIAEGPATKKEERRTFLFITIFLFPIVTVGFIAAFGFVIWMLQIIFGPATH